LNFKKKGLILKKIIPTLLFVIVVLCEIYLSSYKINFLIQFLIALGFLIVGVKVTKSFYSFLVPLLLIFLLGFIGTLINSYALTDTIKDITYFSKPILALFVAYCLIKQQNDSELFVKTVFYIGLFTASIHVVGILLFSGFLSSSISDIRGGFGFDNFIEIFAFYLLLFDTKFLSKNLFQSKWLKYVLLLLFLASIYIYFSRTMLVVFFIVGVTLFGYAKITQQTLKIIASLIIAVLLFYTYLYSIKIDRNSEGVEAFLYKIKIAPEEIFTSKIDRENHKDLWDHWRAYEAKQAFELMNKNPSSYFIGNGYGSLVNLKFKAPLGENGMKYISRLHNGYAFVFYKTGFFGILFLLFFILKLYLKVNTKSEDIRLLYINRLIGSIGVFYFFTTLIITGIYIPADSIIFVLGGFIFLKDTF
jgi:hypothetical protein